MFEKLDRAADTRAKQAYLSALRAAAGGRSHRDREMNRRFRDSDIHKQNVEELRRKDKHDQAKENPDAVNNAAFLDARRNVARLFRRTSADNKKTCQRPSRETADKHTRHFTPCRSRPAKGYRAKHPKQLARFLPAQRYRRKRFGTAGKLRCKNGKAVARAQSAGPNRRTEK